ncbi:MAG: helix-turn-helix transcriptional regulator [Spirochaetes bacterium]|nr:helix-turn-helix transcriptional regulator [Spirochaetota bacterium]
MKEENKEFLTVNDVSKLLKINEKKLYVLLKEGRIPGTKVTGKWLFPKHELEDFMRRESRIIIEKHLKPHMHEKNVILAAGSDDPLICKIQGFFHRSYPDYVLFSSIVGSEEGLRLLNRGFCSIAFCHLYDSEMDDYNFSYMGRILDDPERYVVINLFYRNIGFVSTVSAVGSFRDIVDKGLRFVNRQKGSGIRLHVDEMIEAENINFDKIEGYDEEAFTHLDVLLYILSKKADVGIAAESVACLPAIRFGRIFEERFDMVVLKEFFFDESIQAFVEFIRSDCFSTILKGMGGYDCRSTGRVMYPNQLL